MPIYKMSGKKDGKQQYRVRINYTTREGQAKQIDRVAYGREEAKLLEMRLKQEYSKPTNAPEARITIQQLFEECKEAKSHQVRTTTLEKFIWNVERSILPSFADSKIDRLSNKSLQKWKNDTSDLPLSINTKRGYYKAFHTLLNYAVKMEYLPRNPLNSIGNFTEVYFEQPQDKLHYYTAGQFKTYIAVAKSQACTLTDWGYYIFFNIAFYTGMRKGEINALRWTDIDGEILHVRRSITQKIKGGDIETPPKNRSSYRDLQMPLPLIHILEEHKARQQQDKRWKSSYRICGGPQCLRDSSISNRNRAFAAAAGLPHIRVHDFRHSHASLLVNEGINIQEIARRLGHADIKMTWNTYSHLYPREEERAVQILNKIV